MHSKAIISACTFFLAIFACVQHKLEAEVCGKVDMGAVYVHVDVLDSGHTVKKMDMGGFKADGNVILWKGVCLKPTILYAKNQGELFSSGIGLGHYTPITENFSLTPSAGCLWTQLKTRINFEEFGLFNLKERFRSVSPYLALEASYCFGQGWRICGLYQYSWSRTHTKIASFPIDTSHAQGPNYSLMIERDINESWSISLGGAYNISLSKEKHGLRGYGIRFATAYWF
jgi:hypothetical protein